MTTGRSFRTPTGVLTAALLALATTAAGQAAPAKPPPLKEIQSPGAARDSGETFRTDAVDVVLAPAGAKGAKVEYMIRMKAGDVVAYSWAAPDAKAFWHEFHGHTDQSVTFYKKAEGAEHKGALTAPFDGIHGWYFENRTPNAVTVRLRMGGFYTLVEEKAG